MAGSILYTSAKKTPKTTSSEIVEKFNTYHEKKNFSSLHEEKSFIVNKLILAIPPPKLQPKSPQM